MPGTNQSASIPAAQDDRLTHVTAIARLLDDSIRIPGTDYRIGLEGLIGLLPGIGDLAGGILSGYLIWQSHRAGAPLRLKLKMAGYVLLETLLGTVPLLGDLFDFGFKANLRIARALGHYLSGER